MSGARKTASRGPSKSKAITAKSPHAPAPEVSQLQAEFRSSAVVGGVTDKHGNPTASETAAISHARARNASRTPAALISTEDGKLNGPHDDNEASQMRMLEAFGTNSKPFMVQQFVRIMDMLAYDPRAENRDTALNSCIAMVAAMEPQNEIEAALAVQMAGTHELATHFVARARRASNIEQLNAYVNAATKLQRTQIAQLEAMARLRGKGQQTVRVEHVTVAPGAQAIVGDVHHHRYPPSVEDQSDVATARAGERPALLGPNSIDQALPVSCDAEWPVPHARRRKHRRAPRDSKRP